MRRGHRVLRAAKDRKAFRACRAYPASAHRSSLTTLPTSSGVVTFPDGSVSGLAAGQHTVTIRARSTDASVDYLIAGTGRTTLIATG